MPRTKGFTIIEMLVTLAIVGVLLAVALPAYQKSVQKGNRSDAKITLTRLATLQERYYFRENNYTANWADIVSGATNGAAINSDKSFYTIKLYAPSASVSGVSGFTTCAAGTGWCMVAVVTGSQATDTDCNAFVLTGTGSKTAYKSTGTVNSSACW